MSSGSLASKYQEFVERPLNAIHLGRSAWPLLHRFTLGYPENPTDQNKQKALQFIQSFSKIYPCKVCASDFQIKIKDHPPKLDSRNDLVIWMCEQHNFVNQKLGKEPFRCNVRRIELIHGGSHRKSDSWNIQ
ncbi:UNKNOWN [Stylonychia lemnae]|uniref:Sulfhydryl oxidase n=1 Tax=Stylonychia lemnae TaxID=5949 RepID=A0A078B797_STYLE|nr:UNKNOWN [Stylonychia lemnae]|eukprot:CDW90284.1 UNKNOWN [Stylonychia lemnae]